MITNRITNLIQRLKCYKRKDHCTVDEIIDLVEYKVAGGRTNYERVGLIVIKKNVLVYTGIVFLQKLDKKIDKICKQEGLEKMENYFRKYALMIIH